MKNQYKSRENYQQNNFTSYCTNIDELKSILSKFLADSCLFVTCFFVVCVPLDKFLYNPGTRRLSKKLPLNDQSLQIRRIGINYKTSNGIEY